MAKKLTSGDGWSLIPADGGNHNAISLPPDKQHVKVFTERRKKGKTVTVLSQLVLADDDLKELARKLKNVCGSGGTAKDGEVEIQGDHKARIVEWLRENGWGTK